MLLTLSTIGLMGQYCGTAGGPEPDGEAPTANPPLLSITLLGIEDEFKAVLVASPTGPTINVTWADAGSPVVPQTLDVSLSGPDGSAVALELLELREAEGEAVLIPVAETLEIGTHTIDAQVHSEDGGIATTRFAFAVRDFPNGQPPIGANQMFHYDFASDRDAIPGPDFDVDLERIGLGSPAAPDLSAQVRDTVIQLLMQRVVVAYSSSPPGLPAGSPIGIGFDTAPWPTMDVTRICIGGENPTGSGAIASILTDVNNRARTSNECGTVPATGIFSGELTAFDFDATFRAIFDPLRPDRGGIPVGEHPLDGLVLGPDFDLGTASPEAAERSHLIDDAIDAYAHGLGTIVAHETGHALGLVPEGAPGAGLFGGSGGLESTHNVDASGASPAGNYLMNAGNTFSFSELAGLNGEPLPTFRPLNYAYLRDSVVIDPMVSLIANRPLLAGVDTVLLVELVEEITVSGMGLFEVAATGAVPQVRLVSEGWSYNCVGEIFVSDNQVRATVVTPQLIPGVYDVEVMNPDGQVAVLPGALYFGL